MSTPAKMTANNLEQSLSAGMRRAPCTLGLKRSAALPRSECGSLTQSGSRCLRVPARVFLISLFIYFPKLPVASSCEDFPLRRHADAAQQARLSRTMTLFVSANLSQIDEKQISICLTHKIRLLQVNAVKLIITGSFFLNTRSAK